MEKAISTQRWKTDNDKKHNVKSAYLYHVPIPYAKKGFRLGWRKSRGFLVGRRKFGQKDGLHQLGYRVPQQKERGLGIKNLSVVNRALLGKWG